MYAIWLIPQADIQAELEQLITKLSKEYNGPCFAPHITLLTGLSGGKQELIDKTSELALKINEFKVTSCRLEAGDSYYRSLYLKIVEAGSLIVSYQCAKSLFNQQESDEFMPHLSLLYGSQPRKIKVQLIENLKGKVRLDLHVDRIELVTAHGLPEEWKTVSTEHLTRTW